MTVSVEASVPIEALVATSSELNRGYIQYQANRGILSQGRFEEAHVILGGVIPQRIIPDSLSMADFFGLDLTPKEIFLYRYFREIMPNGDGAKSQNPPYPDVYNLCDQRLLAEILLMEGNIDTFRQFATKYPHIFKQD